MFCKNLVELTSLWLFEIILSIRDEAERQSGELFYDHEALNAAVMQPLCYG